MIPPEFKLYKSINNLLDTGSEYLDPKWKAFKSVAKQTLIDKEKKDEETKLTSSGFIKKYGVSASDYDDLSWRKTSSMKNVSQWRWTDFRLQNALRKLSSSTNNSQLLRMLQNNNKSIPFLKTRGPRTRLQSTQTKFG